MSTIVPAPLSSQPSRGAQSSAHPRWRVDWRDGAYAMAASLISAFVLRRILDGYFFTDDFYHFFRLQDVGWWDFSWRPFHGHLLFVRNTALALMYELFGTNPAPYFWIPLGTHALNVTLLYLLLRRLTDVPELAFLVALAWGMTPSAEATLDWYAVYGQVMASTLILTSLLIVAHSQTLSPWRAALCSLMMFAAAQSFGTGTAVAMAFPLIVLAMQWPRPSSRGTWAVLCGLPVAVLACYVAVHVWAGARFAGVGVAGLRWQPLELIGHLMMAGVTTLTAGWYYSLEWYPSAAAHVIVLAWLVMLVLPPVLVRLGFAHGRPVRPQRATASIIMTGLLIAITTYGAIAASRGSTLDTLRQPSSAIAQQGRWHYTASLGLALVLAGVLSSWRDILPGGAGRRLVLTAMLTGVLLLGWGIRLDEWPQRESMREETLAVLSDIERQIDAAPPNTIACIPNRPFGPLQRMVFFYDQPGIVGVFMMFHDENRVRGRIVRFVEANPQRRKRWTGSGGRLDTLLVAPEQCPSSPAEHRGPTGR